MPEQRNTGGKETGKMISGSASVLFGMKIKPFSMY